MKIPRVKLMIDGDKKVLANEGLIVTFKNWNPEVYDVTDLKGTERKAIFRNPKDKQLLKKARKVERKDV